MKQIIQTLKNFEKIIVIGGGTGGHISPIVSIYKHFQKNNFSQKFVWIGGKNSEEEKEAQKHHITFFWGFCAQTLHNQIPKNRPLSIFIFQNFFRSQKNS